MTRKLIAMAMVAGMAVGCGRLQPMTSAVPVTMSGPSVTSLAWLPPNENPCNGRMTAKAIGPTPQNPCWGQLRTQAIGPKPQPQPQNPCGCQ